MPNKLLAPNFLPANPSLGLLVLRAGIGISLFLKHGLEKPTHFSQMAAHFPNPLHIGSHATLLFSLLSDAICSVLITIGLFTRLAALIIFINILAAWTLVHHFMFFGRGAEHGELCVLYIVSALAIFFAGPGRWSVDAAL
jgi:putative oxidoreductase